MAESLDLRKGMRLMNNSCQEVDEAWPEAWYMVEDGKVANQKCENRHTPNRPVDVKAMRKLGLLYWKMDADKWKYPVKAMPWDPQEATDPRLKALRDDRGYSYADVLTIHPDYLPGFDQHVKNFFTEHIHADEEIRYILGGSGFFDVRDPDNNWVRVHVKKGDLMTLPEGIYHRFTCDETDYIHAMRMFIGVPVWTPINRFTTDTESHTSRKKYICLHCTPQALQDNGGEEKETGE
uniref:Acireductone dioxygenase n=1 Tax=Corethron hystrix TaxID=216773 RepID=A0A7S1BVL9_9STRA|mmetsp:Transcript_42777/g.100455  ORF Transcript_42777/g.100455 Transcript_42777/m.100455 type:complete len:236 (+) Transcript_42777:129-836(+)